MQIQPRLTTQQTPPAPHQPPTEPTPSEPVIFDGFTPRQTMAAATAYTAVIGGTLGLALTRDPSNLMRNVLGGAVAGTILGPAAGAQNLSQRGYSEEACNQAGQHGLTGALVGAGAGCLASLALSVVLPESRLLEAATVVLAVAGGAAGAALGTGGEA